MPTKDGLIILRKRFGKNVKITGQLNCCRQEAVDELPDAIMKITEEKAFLTEQVFNADQVPYSGWEEKTPQKDIYQSQEKQAPGFKAGRDRLTLLFCANVVRFVIRSTLICKATNL